MAAGYLLPDAELTGSVWTPHHILHSQSAKWFWATADTWGDPVLPSQEYTGPGVPLRDSTPLESYSPFSRQSLLLDANSNLEEALKGVGSYMQLRGVTLADGTACSAGIEQFCSLWDSSALSRSRYCCIVGVHSWHRVSELIISHPQIQQIITLPLSLEDYKFWTPSSKSVALLNVYQNWSNSNTVLPRNDPCEVKRMGQQEVTKIWALENRIKRYSLHSFPVICSSLQWVWIAPTSFLAAETNFTAGSPFKIKT